MRRAAARAIMLAVIVTMLGGCSLRAANERPARTMGNVVEQAELTATRASSLYDALVRTRWLYARSRGATSINDKPRDAVLVFRGGALMGTIEALHTLRPSDVRFVRRLTPTETYQKYGRHVSVAGFEVELATI